MPRPSLRASVPSCLRASVHLRIISPLPPHSAFRVQRYHFQEMNPPPLRELFIPDIPWWSLVLRAVIAYAAVMILLRLAGKRQVGQMAMPEFVAVLLISNAVQNSMNGGDNSLAGGLLLAV